MNTRTSILYIGATLPSRSETFVYREVLGLRDRGWDVHTASVHQPERHLGDPQLDDLASTTIHIYRGGLRVIGGALRECVTHPLRSMGTIFDACLCAIRPRELPMSKRPKVMWQAIAALSLAGEVRTHQIIHIHAHMAHVPTTIAMFLAHHLSIPFSFTGHANDIFRERTLLRTKLDRCTFCACISEWHRSFYREFASLDDEKLPVIRCGVDLASFAPAPRAESNALHIVAVGRLVAKKGFDVLIDALASDELGGIDFHCTIVGDGPERHRLHAMLGKHPRGPRIDLVGPKSNRDVRDLLRSADLFVLPCRIDESGDRDGIPVVLMEAMACAVPVISGDIPTIRELVRTGENGLMVQPGSANDLVDALVRTMRDRDLRMRLGMAARECVAEEFSSNVNLSRLEDALTASLGAEDSTAAYDHVRRSEHDSRRSPEAA